MLEQPETDRLLALIARAKKGDKDAHREVAVHVYERYQYRLEGLYSKDPAIGLEDLRVTFFEGVWDGVLEDKGLGNPLYFIGQYGIWRVRSEVRTIARLMEQRARLDVSNEDQRRVVDPMDQVPDSSDDFREIVISRNDAERVVRIIANADLKPRTREALGLILSGAVGEPDEPGFNRRLASGLGVSPQRASQIMADMRQVQL